MLTLPYDAMYHNTTPTLPEAACSVNAFFEVEGFGKCQATGRGTTAQEAATNLRQTIAATREALAPVEPSTAEQVASLLACGLQKATAKCDFPLVERLSKAAALVLAGAVEQGERAELYTVRSQDYSTWYDVDAVSCSCPDSQRHRADEKRYFCKHALAVCFVQKMAQA